MWVRSRIERLKCICPKKKKNPTPTIIASRPVRLRNVTEIITWCRDVMETICRATDWTYKRYNIYIMHQRRTSSDHQRFNSKCIYLVFSIPSSFEPFEKYRVTHILWTLVERLSVLHCSQNTVNQRRKIRFNQINYPLRL